MHISADIEITNAHKPKGKDDKAIIYYKGRNRDTDEPMYGMLYIDPSEMEKLKKLLQ